MFAVLIASPLPAAPLAFAEESIPIVDTHVHLWELKRPEGIYWIAKDNKTLYRDYLPAFHEPIAKANNVQGVVVVQAGQQLPDNQWNLDITAHNKDLYRGVVGNLSEVIGTDKFEPLFKKLIKDKRYVGYRLSGRYQEGLSEEFYRHLKMTADAGRTVDFLVGGYSMEEIDQIAKRIPKLKIILDHFGGVRLGEGPLSEEWIAQFKAVARNPNVYCKVSALFGRFKKQPAPKNYKAYQPIMKLTFEAFGEDRLVFGSDWPVSRTTAEYPAILKITREFIDKKGDAASEKLFFRNAVKFYGIDGSGLTDSKDKAANCDCERSSG